MEKDKVTAAVVLASIQSKAKPLKASIAKIKVKDKTTYELKRQKVANLKELMKLAEAEEKKFLEPLKKLTEDIKELFAPFKQTVLKMDAEAKKELAAYSQSVNNKKLTVQNNLSAGKISLSKAVAKTAELEVSGTMKYWTAECIDATQTPREYLEPNVTAIRAALKAGKQVKGWKWVQKETITI